MLTEIADDIRDLNIQGATNIAFAGLTALRHVINKSPSFEALEHARDVLFNTRPNEPMMFNAVNYVLDELKGVDEGFKAKGLRVIERLEDLFSKNKKQMFKHGKGLLARGSTVFTHCHASSVMGVLKASKRKLKKVYCTESRPRYQGRLTANELVNERIKTSMIVDSALASYVKKADYFLIGCDVISSTYIINKVGSRMISLLCDKYDVPLYVCSLSYKFAPESLSGVTSKVEHRDPKEVWAFAPKKLKVLNPAFDVVDFEGITGFVTELGVLPPDSFIKLMSDRRDNMFS